MNMSFISEIPSQVSTLQGSKLFPYDSLQETFPAVNILRCTTDLPWDAVSEEKTENLYQDQESFPGFTLASVLDVGASVGASVDDDIDDAASTMSSISMEKVHVSLQSQELVDCAICLESISSDKNNCVTACGHTFCLTCLLKSFATRSTCPYCRKPLIPKPVVDTSATTVFPNLVSENVTVNTGEPTSSSLPDLIDERAMSPNILNQYYPIYQRSFYRGRRRLEFGFEEAAEAEEGEVIERTYASDSLDYHLRNRDRAREPNIVEPYVVSSEHMAEDEMTNT